MTTSADLTLLILRLIQGAPRPPVGEWYFVPAFVEATREQAYALLEAAEKPVLVAPLIEPGCVGLWSFASLEASARSAAERERARRTEYFEAKLGLWTEGVDAVRLQEGDSDLRVDLVTFRSWLREYYVAVGHGLERDADTRVARLTVRPPGGNQRPIGLPARFGGGGPGNASATT
jgi:hypothetical protein